MLFRKALLWAIPEAGANDGNTIVISNIIPQANLTRRNSYQVWVAGVAFGGRRARGAPRSNLACPYACQILDAPSHNHRPP